VHLEVVNPAAGRKAAAACAAAVRALFAGQEQLAFEKLFAGERGASAGWVGARMERVGGCIMGHHYNGEVCCWPPAPASVQPQVSSLTTASLRCTSPKCCMPNPPLFAGATFQLSLAAGQQMPERRTLYDLLLARVLAGAVPAQP